MHSQWYVPKTDTKMMFKSGRYARPQYSNRVTSNEDYPEFCIVS